MEWGYTPSGRAHRDAGWWRSLEALRPSLLHRGLSWREVGATRPPGRELRNAALADALACKTEFARHEWAAFGICDLRDDDFIRSADRYFQPVGNEDVVARLLEHLREPSGLKWVSVGPSRPTPAAARVDFVQGRELSNPGLAVALTSKTEFTQEEWEAFGIGELHPDDWIRAGATYFKPEHNKLRSASEGGQTGWAGGVEERASAGPAALDMDIVRQVEQAPGSGAPQNLALSVQELSDNFSTLGNSHPSWEERYAATVRLGRLGRDPGAVLALLDRLRDENSSVRAAAASALATLHQQSARGGPMLRLTVQGLLVVLEDAEVFVRLTARRSLVACIMIAVRLGLLDKDLCMEIRERLSHDRPAIRKAADEVLRFCGGVDNLQAGDLVKKGGALMARIREDESKLREAAIKESEEQGENLQHSGIDDASKPEENRQTAEDASKDGSSPHALLSTPTLSAEVIMSAVGYHHSAVCTSDGALWYWVGNGSIQAKTHPLQLEKSHFGDVPLPTASFLTFGTTVRGALGSKWKNIGFAEPSKGQELRCDALAASLVNKTEFTQQEWASFGIRDVRDDHFVRSGDQYFKPVGNIGMSLKQDKDGNVVVEAIWRGSKGHSAFLLKSLKDFCPNGGTQLKHDMAQVASLSAATAPAKDYLGQFDLLIGDVLEEINGMPASAGLKQLKSNISLPDAVVVDTCVNFKVRRKIAANAVVACGGFHTVAATDDGGVWSFGSGLFGALGHGNKEDQASPSRIHHLGKIRIVAVAAGFAHSIALSAEGFVWTWGCGEYGRLGHGNEDDMTLPNKIQGKFDGQPVQLISAGYSHSIAVTEDGILWAWGKLGLGDSDKRLTPMCVDMCRPAETYSGVLPSYQAARSLLARQVRMYHHDMVLSQNVGDRIGQGRACVALGNCYAAAGHSTRALDLFERSICIFEEACSSGCQDVAVFASYSQVLTPVRSAPAPLTVAKAERTKSTPDANIDLYYKMRKAALRARLRHEDVTKASDSYFAPAAFEQLSDGTERLNQLLARGKQASKLAADKVKIAEEALKNLKATNAAFASTLRMGRPVSPPANVQAYAGDRRIEGIMEEAGEYMSIRSRMHTYMQTMSVADAANSKMQGHSEHHMMFAGKRAAIEALGHLAERGDIRVLEYAKKKCSSSCWGIRCAAAATIGRLSIGDMDSVQALRDRLTADADPSVRAAAASGILSVCENCAGHQISSGLQPECMPHQGLREVVGALLAGLDDQDDWVRLSSDSALRACMKTFFSQTIDGASNTTEPSWCGPILVDVMRHLVHPNQHVRNAAYASLFEAGIFCESRFGRIVARHLAEMARDTTLPNERRAHACLLLMKHRISEFTDLSDMELHGYSLWHSDLSVRRSAATELCSLSSRLRAYTASGVKWDKTGATNPTQKSRVTDDTGPQSSGEDEKERQILVQMLSMGLDDTDVEVRRMSLTGLEQACSLQDESATLALAELLQKDSDPSNLAAGMRCLMRNNAVVAQHVISSLTMHDNRFVRRVARDCLNQLENNLQVVLLGIHHMEWPSRLACLGQINLLFSKRGAQLLSSRLIRDCRKPGFDDGDCVLAVIDRQLHLDMSIQEMREAAPFVATDGIKVDAENIWQDLENVFTCRIVLIDLGTLRILRQAAAREGMTILIGILNGHAFAISAEGFARLKQEASEKHYGYDALISGLLNLLGNEDENTFVRYAAARTLGDVAVDGDLQALAALASHFSVNSSLQFATVSAFGKLCTGEICHDKTLQAVALKAMASSAPAISVPILIALAEIFALEADGCACGEKSDEFIKSGDSYFHIEGICCELHDSRAITYIEKVCEQCERLLVQGPEIQDASITSALRWVRSRLLPVLQLHNLGVKPCVQSCVVRDDRKRIKKEKAAAKELKLRQWRDGALEELMSDAGVRRFDALGRLGLRPQDLNDDAANAIAERLSDEIPRVRIRAMALLRRLVKSCPGLLMTCVDKLLDVVRKREREIATTAVICLGDIMPKGHARAQEVVAFLLNQLSIQKVNYLGHGQRRNVWDRVVGFRQATLEALFKVMPGADSKMFVGKLAMDDLDSHLAQVRDSAYEILAEQVSEEARGVEDDGTKEFAVEKAMPGDEEVEGDTRPQTANLSQATLYDNLVIKLLKMMTDCFPSQRHFAVMALPEICQRQDLRILLALRKALEDEGQDATTRVLAAKAMLLIDPQDVGVQTAIRSVLASCNDGSVSSTAPEPCLSARSPVEPPPPSMTAMPLGHSSHVLSSRLALILSSASEFLPHHQDETLPAAESTTPKPGEGGSCADDTQDHRAEARRIKTKVLHVPRSLSKMGRSNDDTRHIRRKMPQKPPNPYER